MKEQEIEVRFPDIRIVVDSYYELELKAFKRKVRTIKLLRTLTQKHTSRFMQAVVKFVKDNTGYGKRPLNTVHLPKVEVITDGDVVCSLGEYRATAIVDLGKWFIPSTLVKKMPSAVADVCAKVIENKGVEIVFKGNGATIPCTLRRNNLQSWAWQLHLTEVILKYELGREVKIKYGSFLHNALWLRYEDADHWNLNDIDPKTIATLNRLELLNGGEVTNKGKQVLTELEEIDPSVTHSLIILFAGALFGTQTKNTPVFQFAKENDFIGSGNYTPEILQKGQEWLIDNCETILNRPNCPDKRRVQLIKFMPLDRLPVFLAHSSTEVRLAARSRAAALS